MNSSNPSNPRSAPPTSSKSKPLASISLDLDDLWSYMKIYGDPRWEEFPSFLDVLIPDVLDLLDELGLIATFFVVGQDAALDKNRELLGQLTERGHEVGNHSFHHEAWLYRFSREQIEQELVKAEEQIAKATSQNPVGFRGPGFSWSLDLLDLLEKRGYLYDTTVMPTYIGSIARAYYFRNSKLTRDEKRMRMEGGRGFKDGMRPVKPYFWGLNSGRHLLEIPVTTVPMLKTPFHMSYLLFLNQYSTGMMLAYLKLALFLCRLTGTEPSFVIHPTDLLTAEQVPFMRFFPGMSMTATEKRKILRRVIEEFSKSFRLVNMQTYAQAILKRDCLSVHGLN